MRIIAFLSPLFLIFFFTATCSSTTTQQDTMEITGTIEPQGITSYQYGTHTISNEEQFYAIRSEVVDLDDYVGKTVTVTAEKIEGYPLEGGPDYLLILKIK